MDIIAIGIITVTVLIGFFLRVRDGKEETLLDIEDVFTKEKYDKASKKYEKKKRKLIKAVNRKLSRSKVGNNRAAITIWTIPNDVIKEVTKELAIKGVIGSISHDSNFIIQWTIPKK